MHISQLLHEDHKDSSSDDFLQQSENQAFAPDAQKIDFWRHEHFIRAE